MPTTLHRAIWTGPQGLGQLPDGTRLNPGDEADITAEDLASSHWTALDSEPEPEPTAAPEIPAAPAEAPVPLPDAPIAPGGEQP